MLFVLVVEKLIFVEDEASLLELIRIQTFLHELPLAFVRHVINDRVTQLADNLTLVVKVLVEATFGLEILFDITNLGIDHFEALLTISREGIHRFEVGTEQRFLIGQSPDLKERICCFEVH